MRNQAYGILAATVLVAGCSGFGGGDVIVPSTPDAGYGGAGAGLDGLGGPGGIATGTLPGTGIADMVFFSADQSTLSAEAIGTLDAQIGWLQGNPGAPVLIEGHADERGTGEYNFALGSSRASAVRNHMVSRGIPDQRISIITYGRERPVATCPDESCWAQNRRAVTVVTGGAGT